MKTKSSLIAIIAALILTSCTTTPPSSHHDFSGVPPTDIAVKITCSNPNMEFTGTIITDGSTEKLSGTGTTTYHATGHEFICSFEKVKSNGSISISVSEDSKELGNSTSGSGLRGVRAEILHAKNAQHTIFTAF